MKYLLLCLVVMLAGCGATRDTSAVTRVETKARTVQVVEVKAPVVDAAGATVLAIASITTTTTDSLAVTDTDHKEHAVTKVDGPPIIAPLIATAAGATPWGAVSGVAGMLLTAATGMYAAHKSTQSTAERKRADEHKADAAEGWEKAQAYALQVAPRASV